MKRSYAVKLIAKYLDFLNGKPDFERDDYTEVELSNASLILLVLEQAKLIQPPFVEDGGTYVDYWGEHYPTGDNKWEPED